MCPITVLPCVDPDRPVTSTSGQGVNAWPCWQTPSSSSSGRHPQRHAHRGGRCRSHRRGRHPGDGAGHPAGYQKLLELAERHPGQRVWAIESTGGYGAGLTRFLQAHAEQVVELDRPSGPPAASRVLQEPAGSLTLLGGSSAESGPHAEHGGLSEDGDVVASGMDGEASLASSMDGQVEGRTAYLNSLQFDVGEPGG